MIEPTELMKIEPTQILSELRTRLMLPADSQDHTTTSRERERESKIIFIRLFL